MLVFEVAGPHITVVQGEVESSASCVADPLGWKCPYEGEGPGGASNGQPGAHQEHMALCVAYVVCYIAMPGVMRSGEGEQGATEGDGGQIG